MFILGKKLAYWEEKYGGIFLGIIISIPLFFIDTKIEAWRDFIKEIPSLGMCAFGFLLTFLGIILQGKSKTIKWMKSREVLFRRFISFNRRVVILSVVLLIYSYFLAFFNFEWIKSLFISLECYFYLVQKTLISCFLILLVWFLHDVIYFIHVFYLLIKRN